MRIEKTGKKKKPEEVNWMGIFLVLLLAVGNGLHPIYAQREDPKQLILASTTSTLDSGLFDALIPPFEKKNNCRVKVIAVGTGQAIRLARDGNADILFVHDRNSEEKFVADGFGEERLDVMHNDFVIIGPENDPAKIAGLNAVEAFRKIHQVLAPFTSRGDDSGTYKMEQRIWKDAGIDPQRQGYLESGSGMETTLRIALERKAYCLIDRATWLAHRRENNSLCIQVQGEAALLNPYSVIVVSRNKFAWVNQRLGRLFSDYIRGKEGQKIIREFGRDRFGEPLFFPDVIR